MAMRWKREGRAAEGPGGQEGACPSTGQPPSSQHSARLTKSALEGAGLSDPQCCPGSSPTGRHSSSLSHARVERLWGHGAPGPLPRATVPPPVSNQDKDLGLRPTQAAIGQATALHPQTTDRLKVSRQDSSCWTAHTSHSPHTILSETSDGLDHTGMEARAPAPAHSSGPQLHRRLPRG